MTAGFGGRGSAGSAGPAWGHLGDALSGLLDGELPPAQVAAAQAHLLACPDCGAELQVVRQARAWVRALPPVDPPSGFYDRVLLGTGRAPLAAGAGLRRRAGLAALGAAAAAVTVLGVGSPRQGPVAPAAPRIVEAHAVGASVGSDLITKLAPMGIPVSFGR
jgi:anti-sigma factor RsiW